MKSSSRRARRPSFKKPSPKFSKADVRRDLRRDERAKLQKEILELRVAARKAAAERDEATRKARAACRERAKVAQAEADRLFKEAEKARRKAHTAKKKADRDLCSIEAQSVRVEKQAAVDLARNEATAHRLALKRARGGERDAAKQDKSRERQETDEEVEWNLEAEDAALVPIFRSMRRSIKGKPDMSRTEQMLEWAKENPEEIAARRAAAVPSDDAFARQQAAHQGEVVERPARRRRGDLAPAPF